jgi:inosine-uridine nucleoside N-ribohydrolase
MEFPKLSAEFLLKRLEPPKGRVRMVLDTDTYNEIDDQFALVYALLSKERLDLEAVYAAPFHNERSSGPADGMEKSYEEILRLLNRMHLSPEGYVYRGSKSYLKEAFRPCPSEAAEDLVKRAMSGGTEPLYVAAIGAITNIASAVLMEPKIIEKIVIVWLGGHAPYWPNTREFNLQQDVPAARLLLDCGVPFVQIPCMPVASHLLTTVPDLDYYYPDMGEVGKYLVNSFKSFTKDHFAWAKEIWDISAIAYLVNAEWVPADLIHSPILTDQVTWSQDPSRHFIKAARQINRNAVFRDMLEKLCRK